MKSSNYSKTHLIFTLLGSLVLLFLIAPVVGMFLSVKAPFLFDTLKDPEVKSSMIFTLCISAITTLILAIPSIPLAYILARKRFPGKGIIEALIDIPVVIPHSAAGIAILGIISRDSFIGTQLASIGLNLVGTSFAIGAAMAFVSLPFLINAARDGFAATPERLEDAARTLGADNFKVFTKISLPLARRSIITGMVMMFARGMSEFGAVVIVAYYPMITPVMIFDRFNSYGLSYARPIAVIFTAVTLLIFVLLRIYQKRDARNK